MAMTWSRRGVLGAVLAGTVPSLAGIAVADEKAAASIKGKLTDQSLGTLLKAMGFDVTTEDKRYDFAFKATIQDQEWELSMSTVLSQDGSSLWVMAWLDELPKAASDVPRTALLRLLSDNDKLGKGKFFTYIAANRRFVLQRVVPNDSLTSEKFRAVLDDLGQSVVETHPHWSVSNWNTATTEEPTQVTKAGAPIKGSGQTQAAPTSKPATKIDRTAINDAKAGSMIKK